MVNLGEIYRIDTLLDRITKLMVIIIYNEYKLKTKIYYDYIFILRYEQTLEIEICLSKV